MSYFLYQIYTENSLKHTAKCTFYFFLDFIIISFSIFAQVLYYEKDSDGPPSVQVVEGDRNLTLFLGSLQKYTMYALQVLAFTRIGDGPPSSPVLLRTKEDGRNFWPVTRSLFSSFTSTSHLFLFSFFLCRQRHIWIFILF